MQKLMAKPEVQATSTPDGDSDFHEFVEGIEDDTLSEVAGAMAPDDDPNLACMTPLTCIVGLILGSAVCAANTVLSFRTNSFAVPALAATIVVYPLKLANKLNYKQHALIYIIVAAMATPPFGLDNVVVQKYLLGNHSLSTMTSIVFVLATQCIALAFAGLARKFLVQPKSMVWPSILSRKFFLVVVGLMACFQVLPTYALGSAKYGVGLLSFTFDWSLISNYNPITTPLWAMLNQFFGFYTSFFGSDRTLGTTAVDGSRFPLGFALNTWELFNGNGSRIDPLELLDSSYNLNSTFYDLNRPIQMTSYFAVTYASSFIAFVAAMVHCYLWYGGEIVTQLRAIFTRSNRMEPEDANLDKYPMVPASWYWLLLLLGTLASAFVCEFGEFELRYYGVMLAVVIGFFSLLPLGTIVAISGQEIGLMFMSEFIGAILFPHKVISVMSFKTLSYLTLQHGITLTSHLKLAQYLHLPPRTVFMAQGAATFIAAAISVLFAKGSVEMFGQAEDGRFLLVSGIDNGWSANGYRIFLSTGIVWGAIGPNAFFGAGSKYFSVLIGFAVGLILPIIPWALHFVYPGSYWHLVSIPLIFAFPTLAGGTRSDLISPLIIAIVVNYFIRRFKKAWWKRYAYTMSAGLDVGAAITLLVVFYINNLNKNRLSSFPIWAMNPADGEHCAPDQYLTCMKQRIVVGSAFNVSRDAPECVGVI
ncbi:OPT superfamily oligopeptide transporter [Rhizoclosmatium globosum]|uniref:OPT superfamily oligopeptide transporter n=1 Tax=Rhizoclosmatium globosum TaxID=329046 RepID=A0A1Y2CWX7_9FUNG|nr:OPT superfamily oligopeptide transporter [Rhizoclosmatium globosum]|eukprot:ORY51538.1 OPT superfamily oligopeptide transporter [Rhizoclosmatium globosum]